MTAGRSSPVRPERVAEIVAMDDQPVLRNLLITQTYFELSESMNALLGRDNANLCTFAERADAALAAIGGRA